MGERYRHAATAVARDFLNGLVRELFPEPVIEVKGSHYVDITLNRIHGKLTVNLINTSGPHGDPNIHVFDEIQPVGPLTVSIRMLEAPLKVYLEPDHRQVDYSYRNGKVELVLPALAIHDILVME